MSRVLQKATKYKGEAEAAPTEIQRLTRRLTDRTGQIQKEIRVLGTPLQAGPFKATGPRVGACARKDPEVRRKVLEPDYLGSESYVTSEFNLCWRQAPLPSQTPATGSPKEPRGLLTFRSSSRSRAELLVSPGPLEGMAGSWAVGGSLGFEGSGGAAGLQRRSYCGLREQELKLTHRS